MTTRRHAKPAPESDAQALNQRMAAAEARLAIMAEMLDIAPLSITVHDFQGRFLYANRKTFEIHGYTESEFMALNLHDVDVPTSEALIEARMRLIAEKGEAVFEVAHYRKDGSTFPLEVSAKPVTWAGIPALMSLARDLTERKAAEEERERIRLQLTQAQKMESVGRLAGGVAHDFNNMLGVILGHAELAMEEVEPSHPLHAGLVEIQKAAQRSADLTRQLLAFARKQTISPKVLNLNDTVADMLKMLQRLIGENIVLAWKPGAEPWPVLMDPIQLDQVLANLAINARDAITGVGRVTIETSNIAFDAAYCADHPGSMPGDFVLLAVSDNGRGMTPDVAARLFEPFFTTKEAGKGTGLGLATVYGIVKQNHGFINVYSEPGLGATFRIYLPRHTGADRAAAPQAAPGPTPTGRETVLLVEDEPALLTLGRNMLESLGYSVLAAATPGEAIRLAEQYAGDIHLLMTDVIMPEMNGRDLARRLLSLYPDLHCLFMSGYTTNAIAHHGVLDTGVHFIQKPFSRRDLAAKLCDALGRPAAGSGTASCPP